MSQDSREIEKLFFAMGKANASDLHLKAGSAPIMRIDKRIRRVETQPLTDEAIWALVGPILPEEVKKRFVQTGNVDFAHSVPGVGRFRIDIYRQRGSISVAARRVRFDIPTLKQLNLPPSLEKFTVFEQGLCIIAGPTGCGKSTTLAAMLDGVNHTRRCHILTIEDPIEYLYRDDMAFINQREVGIDVESFQTGLKYGLRADPDVILVGEMRDPDTFETALQASETGHLVFGTVHASNAAQTIGRILDLFPTERHDPIRQILAFNLKAVAVQRLLPGSTQEARMVPAVEVMFVNPAIKKLIRDGADEHIADVIRGGKEEGMQDITTSIHQLVTSRLVSRATAMEYAPNPEALEMLMKGIVVGGSQGGILR